jgi:hypothetical protein
MPPHDQALINKWISKSSVMHVLYARGAPTNRMITKT